VKKKIGGGKKAGDPEENGQHKTESRLDQQLNQKKTNLGKGTSRPNLTQGVHTGSRGPAEMYIKKGGGQQAKGEGGEGGYPPISVKSSFEEAEGDDARNILAAKRRSEAKRGK